MSIATYNPPSTKIIHWTGVDFVSRPSAFPPVHLVQYDQRLPIVAVNLYNNGKKYMLPTNINANVLMEKGDGTFVSNPVLGCNSDRSVLYFETTYQMLYFSGIIKPVIELKLSDTETGSSSAITIIVDRNPVQENARESSNEYKSSEQFMNQALEAKNQAVSSANSASQSKTAAAQSAANAATSAQNAKDYLMSIESMSIIGPSIIFDSSGQSVTDSNGNNVTGVEKVLNVEDLRLLQNQIFVLNDRKEVLENRLYNLEQRIEHLTKTAILDSNF